MSGRLADVAVVGAGLAGLTAAAELERLGVSVVVLEARDEVGGRTRSRPLDRPSSAGATADLGGQFVGPQHRRMRRLVSSLGLQLVPAGLERRPALYRLSGREGVGFVPPLSLGGVWSLGRALLALKRLSLRVDPYRPWCSPGAEDLDRRSLAGWLDELGLQGRAREVLVGLISGFATVGAGELSLLQVLWWLSRAGGLLPGLRAGSAFFVAEGAQAVSRGLAARLRGPLLLETPVTSLEQEGGCVTVRGEHGQLVRARRAIVAVPTPVLGSISFSPPLDAPQRLLVEELRFGRGVKVSCAVPPASPGRQRVFLGGLPVSIGWRTGGTLAGIAYNAEAAERPEDEMVADLAGAFGVPPAEVGAAGAVDWGRERFAGGTYVAFKPGQIVRHGPTLRRPHGRVQFAGAERSSWPQFMEGAAESGEEAARRVLDGLRRERPRGAKP